MTWDASHLLPKARTDTCSPQCMSAAATDPASRAKHCQGLGLINRWPDTEQKHKANKGKGREQKKMEGKYKPQWETQMRTWPAAIRPRGLDRLYLIWSSLPQNQSNLPQWADIARNQTANPAQKGSWCGAEWGNIRLCRIVVGMQTITAIKVFALLKKRQNKTKSLHLHSLNLQVELRGNVSCCSLCFWIRHHIFLQAPSGMQYITVIVEIFIIPYGELALVVSQR